MDEKMRKYILINDDVHSVFVLEFHDNVQK